ncbi:hypothetical protein AAMO2058_001713300 [Amorphochlora amoebiformis]
MPTHLARLPLLSTCIFAAYSSPSPYRLRTLASPRQFPGSVASPRRYGLSQALRRMAGGRIGSVSAYVIGHSSSPQISSMPNQRRGRAFDIHIGGSHLTIPFNRDIAKRVLSRLREIEDIYAAIQEEHENDIGLIESEVPDIIINEHVISEDEAITLEMTCDPNIGQTIQDAMVLVSVKTGSVEASGEVSVVSLINEISEYINMPHTVRKMPRSQLGGGGEGL